MVNFTVLRKEIIKEYIELSSNNTNQVCGQPKKDKATYKEFNYKTDEGYYWISVLCSNCLEDKQIGVLLGIKVNSSRLKFLACPKCKVKGTLSQAFWNGKYYVKI